jgi:copper transport protein
MTISVDRHFLRDGPAGAATASPAKDSAVDRRPASRLVALLALLGGLFGAALLFAGPASAHASLVTSDPADGSRLKAAPHAVTLTFDENVGLGDVGYLHVTNQAGRRVDAGAAVHPAGDGTKVTDTLTSGLGDGTYTASFRVVSADSHPVAGTIRFVVGNGPLARGSVSAGSTNNPETSEAFAISRWISFAGLALLGGTWLVLTVWPAGRDDLRARRTVWAGWLGVAVGGLLELLLQGPYSAGTGPNLFSWSLLDNTLHTDYGQLHSLRLLLLGVLAVLYARSLQADARPARWEAVYGAVALGLVWTFSDAGHGATTSPAWLSVSIDMLHLLSMAAWVGGLAMVLGSVLPRREPDELRAVLPVFSRVAFTSVLVLIASGTYSAWRGIGTIHAIFTTTYGVLVVFKVALLAGILAVANVSRRLVHRRAVAYAMTDALVVDEEDVVGDPVGTERLRRAVYVETLVAFVVLAFSALLVSEPRGKEALAASYREPVSATTSIGGNRTATVTADPGTHGLVSLRIELSKGATPTSITATATQNKAEIGPLTVKLTREGPLLYDGSTSLPVAGKWEIDLVVTTSTFDATTTDVTLSLH